VTTAHLHAVSYAIESAYGRNLRLAIESQSYLGKDFPQMEPGCFAAAAAHLDQSVARVFAADAAH
jgi:hypothetical protein